MSIIANVISKKTAAILSSTTGEHQINLTEPSVVKLKMPHTAIKSMARAGNDLIITVEGDDSVIVIKNYFTVVNGVGNSLVFEDQNQQLWLADLLGGEGDLAVSYTPIDSIEPLLIHDSDENLALWMLGLGGGAALSGVFDSDSDNPAPPPLPPAPVLHTPDAPESYADNVGKVQDDHSTAPTTDDDKPGINIGNVEDGETPVLYVDGEEVPSDYDPDTGTLTPTDSLPDGEHEITYTLKDGEGNESDHSGPIVIEVDTTPPAKPDAPESYADDAGSVQDDHSTAPTTDDDTPGINIGDVADDETPVLYVDGEEVPSDYDPDTGTLTPLDPLPEGEHEITYTLKDEMGNESDPSDPIVIEVDTTPPAKPDAPESYADDAGSVQDDHSTAPTTDDDTPGINIGNVEDGETPVLYVDGEEVPSDYDPDTGTLTPLDPLPEGEHEITYTLKDEAGNESDHSDPIIIEVDTAAPAATAVLSEVTEDTGESAQDFVTSDRELMLSFTVTGTL
ncbi:MAG: Ig-like domain-containing protein, partial [Zoogloeaceae bacterium]|nr:Ig-like domain-containing protein [Zoogloeaceae bacterium]